MELAGAGKTEAEIGKERKAWDTVKQQKERRKQSEIQARQAREEKLRLEREMDLGEQNQQHERQCEKAREAADLLRNTLGKDFEAFRSLMADASGREFIEAVLAGPPGQ